MKIAAVQMDMAFACPEENFKKAETLVRRAAENTPDVILLPETWNVGFYPKEALDKLADEDASRTSALFSALAKELQVNIVAGSVAAKFEDGVHNTSLVFDRTGACAGRYDKTHLFSPMDEDKYFVKGAGIGTYALDGRRCATEICYDIRFPELTRTVSVQGLDFLFLVSQWPDVRVPQLHALLKARAIENQMFVVCCNSCGMAPGTRFGGQSIAFDPLGSELASAGTEEEVLFADCDLSVIEGIRSSINVFRDRRPEIYGR
ncbi:MAG: carbon-nitrogen family hydrolase [Clostridia bacterium]|nr:carbon-nitrogen family hydrolase [Clostridia bacterium]